MGRFGTSWENSRVKSMLRQGLMHCSKLAAWGNALFDHLVGASEQRRGHGEAERIGGREINEEIEFGRLLDRDVSRLRSAQNLIDQVGSSAPHVSPVRSIGHQTSHFDRLPYNVHRR